MSEGQCSCLYQRKADMPRQLSPSMHLPTTIASHWIPIAHCPSNAFHANVHKLQQLRLPQRTPVYAKIGKHLSGLESCGENKPIHHLFQETRAPYIDKCNVCEKMILMAIMMMIMIIMIIMIIMVKMMMMTTMMIPACRASSLPPV